MIEFNSEQETKILSRDCRTWTELVAQEWYNSDYAGATDYPAQALTQHLRAVYFTCHDAGVDNMEYVSRLGFTLLRANTLQCDPVSVEALVGFFIHHAKGDNVDYAQNWIDLYLEDN
jgi:hypothetical protein